MNMSFLERRRYLWILFLPELALLAIALATSATTLARLQFAQLAQESTAVARLRCLSSESLWEGGEILTETRFEVLELEKGLLPRLVTVRMVGGRTGHLHSRVDGVPVFRPGEEVYLFLWGREGQAFSVMGWSQGTFRISRNARTGAETVTQDSAATPVFDPQTQEFRREGVRNLPLIIFREKLRRTLERKP
jgi:hypothetical protein